jgi:hypothetical protein
MSWWASLAIVCVVGLSLIGYSRYQLTHPAPKPAAVPPTASDTWPFAISFYTCGKFQPALPANPPPEQYAGIRSLGRGLAVVAPGQSVDPSLYTGTNATLGTFVAHYPGLELTSDKLGYPPITPASTTTTTSPTTTTTTGGSTTTTTRPATTTTKASTTTTGGASSHLSRAATTRSYDKSTT